jgi:multidrug efflux pump subunit AcrB
MPEFRKKFPQILTSVEGESKASAETGSSMVRGFLVGLVGIFILLSFQFRSYIEPVVVMVAVPLTFIGVIWGHLFMDLNLSMPGLMGAASLAGIAVNDSILLIEFIKIHVSKGATVAEAARRASRERFRAVLLTSLTTIAGLLPLLSERSPQAQVLIPLAVSIVFGLMASTVLVLIVVPALYVILGDFGLTSVKADETQRRIAPTNIIKH